jgi:long-chain acyl-CoA synthetase
MKRTVFAMLEEAEKKYPEVQYVLKMTDAGWEGRGFGRVRSDARAFAACLLSRGFRKGQSVSILAEGSPEWVTGEFGVLMAGGVSVPLSIKLLAEEIPFRVRHSESRAIITTGNQIEKVLTALSTLGNPDLLVFYLDDDTQRPDAACARTGFPRQNLVRFTDAIAEGTAALPARNAELDAIAETTAEDDVVTICYTSGTTGDPKGIMLTNVNYYANCKDGIELFEGPYYYRTLLILPVDHSFAHTVGIYAALLCGISLYFVDPRGGGIAILRNIPINLKQVEPTFLLTVPALSGNFMKKIVAGVEEKGGFIEKLFKAGIAAGIAINGDGFTPVPLLTRLRNVPVHALAKALIFNKIRKMVFGSNIKFCVGGGALLDLKQQEFFAAFGVPIFQGYGLTEAAPVISSNTPSKHKFGTSGIVAPTVECRIQRPDGTGCKPGETGEIVIRGENVMKGYFRNPEASAKALRDGWLYTGDLACYDADRFLVVVGREKALLIAEDGEKYSPEEIEEAIGGSTDCFAQIMAYNEQRKYTSAIVALDNGRVERIIKAEGIGTAGALMDRLVTEFYRFKTDAKARKVPSNWIPATFLIAPEGFGEKDGTVNSTMKLVRHRAAQVHADGIEYLYSSEGSRPANKRNIETLKAMFKLS